MVSSIGSSQPYQHYQALSAGAQASRPQVDSDGDTDNSRAGEVENQRGPVSATAGTRINTSA